MRKGQKLISKRMLAICGLSLLIVLMSFAAGCGKKEPVETDVTLPAEEPEAPAITPEPAVDEPDAGAALPPVDYAAMDPHEYGIEDIFFEFDVYELDGDALAILAANARIMRDHPDLVWMIEGHCDDRGTVEYNLALGEKRAKTTRDYLISLGTPARQLKFTSYGEERPFAYGQTEASWAQNRRSHFSRP